MINAMDHFIIFSKDRLTEQAMDQCAMDGYEQQEQVRQD
jgi:hypothetical protein